jgi:hypothetical protein
LLIFRSKRSEGCLQPLGQAGRAIVVAHAIKNIGHCGIPLTLDVLTAHIRALPARHYLR